MRGAVVTAFILFGIAVMFSHWRQPATSANTILHSAPDVERQTEMGPPVSSPRTARSSFSPLTRVHSSPTSISSFAEQSMGFDRSRSTEPLRSESELGITNGAPRLDPQPGDFVVKWGNRWWRAEVVAQNGEQTLIRYVGYGAEWDEWITPDRARTFAEGDVIQDPAEQTTLSSLVDLDGSDIALSPSTAKFLVEWKGRWWPADVLDAQDGKYLIHYEGYGDNWDEWIALDRLRAVELEAK
jgi:hypothetical protein